MKTSLKCHVSLPMALASICLCLAPLGLVRAASISLDPTFSPPFFATPDYAKVTLLPDGSYVMNFNVDALSDQPTGAIMKFLPDGTLDTSFNFSSDYDFAEAVAPLSDGQLIVTAQRDVYGVFEYAEHILRLNPDGSIDPTFNSADATTTLAANPSATDFGGEVRRMAIQSDGKILLAGFFGAFGGTVHPGIVRLLANGTLDSGFAPITLQFDTGAAEYGLWAAPAIQPTDGKILIAGDFSGVNGVAAPGVARLNSNGTLDGTFNAAGFTRFNFNRPTRGVVVQGDGKIIIGGEFNVTGGAQNVPLVRLNSDGSRDQNYIYPTVNFLRIRDLVLQSDGKPVAVDTSVYRFNTDGSVDSTFSQPVLVDTSASQFAEAFNLNLQSDGRILIGGLFNEVANPTGTNLPRWSVARLNSDGTLDTTLATFYETAEKVNLTSFARQFDGTTLVASEFTGFSTLAPAFPHSYGRLLADGSLDPTFDPLASLPDGAVTALGFAPLPDGNIFAFGTRDDTGVFTYGVLHPDGTSLGNNYNGNSGVIFSSAQPQPDGRVLVSSSDAQSVINNKQLQRLNTDGSLDVSFQLDASILADTVQRDVSSGLITNMAVGNKILSVAADGTILFSYLAFDSTFRLVRLSSTGTLDGTFPSASIPATTIPFQAVTTSDGIVPALQPLSPGFTDVQLLTGGQTVVTGDFASYAGTNAHGIVRLNANGTVDASFQAGGGAQWTQTTETATQRPSIDNIELENDGKFLITGTFEAYNGVAAPGIASLNADGSFFEALGRIATRKKFDSALTILVRQPDGSFLLSGPYTLPGQTESPSFIHINSFGGTPIISSPLTTNGFVGLSFAYQIVASGQPTSYSATGLPSGLSIDSQTGVISGSSTVLGTFTIDISATNADGTTHATLTLNVLTPPPPVIISPLTASGTVGQQFVYQFVATGATLLGVDSVTLPPGLTFDASISAISGTPTAAGTSQVALSASNAGGTTTATLTLTVQPAPLSGPVIISSTSSTGRPGFPFSFQVITSGTSAVARLSASGLPAGLSFDPLSGQISGTPAAEGSFAVILTVTDGNLTAMATLQLTFTLDPTVPVIVSPSQAGLLSGQPFSYTIVAPSTADPATDPTTYSLVGTLPPGLSFNPVTGTISGTFQSRLGNMPGPKLSGGIVTNVQLFATNSHGTGTIPLLFLLTPSGADNISTRLAVGISSDVLIGGFIVTGNAPKKVIIRAIGPSLPVAGTLQDPTLELHDSSGLLGSNDNWRDTQEQEIIDTTIPPTDDRESAIVATLAPADPKVPGSGAYTVIVSGKSGMTGIGLVEVYDLGTASLDISSESKLANISTRGQVQTGDNVLIGGFIVAGSTPSNILVRAIGPELTAQGVTGALQDTTLELHDGSGNLLTSNDDWQSTQEQQIIATGAPPTDPRESAIVATLNPGSYTAIVRGKNNTTGVALVEAYVLP